MEFLARYVQEPTKRSIDQLNLPDLLPPLPTPIWHIFKEASAAKMPDMALRVLLGRPPRSLGDMREIARLPNPYGMAAQLLPDEGWRFVRLAGLHAIAKDGNRVPEQRTAARAELRATFKELTRRKPGRPSGAVSLATLIRLKEHYGALKDELKRLKQAPATDALQTLKALLQNAVGAPTAKLTERFYAEVRKKNPPEGALTLLGKVVGLSPKVLGNVLLRKHVDKANLPPDDDAD